MRDDEGHGRGAPRRKTNRSRLTPRPRSGHDRLRTGARTRPRNAWQERVMALRRPRSRAAALPSRDRAIHARSAARGRRSRRHRGLRLGRSREIRPPGAAHTREHRPPRLERSLREREPRRRDRGGERRARLEGHRRARDQVDAGDGHGGARRDHDRHRLVPVPEHRCSRPGSGGPASRGGGGPAGDYLQHLP